MKDKLFKFIFTIPVVLYSIFLILLPLVYIFIISFFKSDSYGGMIHIVTLNNYIQLFNDTKISNFKFNILYSIINIFDSNCDNFCLEWNRIGNIEDMIFL